MDHHHLQFTNSNAFMKDAFSTNPVRKLHISPDHPFVKTLGNDVESEPPKVVITKKQSNRDIFKSISSEEEKDEESSLTESLDEPEKFMMQQN